MPIKKFIEGKLYRFKEFYYDSTSHVNNIRFIGKLNDMNCLVKFMMLGEETFGIVLTEDVPKIEGSMYASTPFMYLGERTLARRLGAYHKFLWHYQIFYIPQVEIHTSQLSVNELFCEY